MFKYTNIHVYLPREEIYKELKDTIKRLNFKILEMKF